MVSMTCITTFRDPFDQQKSFNFIRVFVKVLLTVVGMNNFLLRAVI